MIKSIYLEITCYSISKDVNYVKTLVHLMASNLHQTVLQKLTKLIETTPDSRLPSMNVLCRHFGVSRPTLAKAASLLREKGVIEFQKGQRIRIKGRTQHISSPQQSASERFVAKIIEKIREGTLKAGDILPKNAYYVAKEHLSASTVTRAFQKLEVKKIIHKQGNRWIAGPEIPNQKQQIALMLQPYTILVIMERLNAWRELCSTDPSLRFCQSFIAEAEKRGILIDQVLTEATSYSERVHTSGKMAITERIHQTGERLLGALIVGTRKQVPDLEYWVSLFLQIKKPLVWLDQYNENAKKTFIQNQKYFTRCYFDYTTVASTALDTARGLDHRVIGFPTPSDDKRYVQLRKFLAISSDFEIISYDYPGDFWNRFFGRKNIIAETKRLAQNGIPHVRKVLDPFVKMNRFSAIKEIQWFSKHTRGYIVSLSPLLVPYIKNKRVTILIAPDNEWGKRYYYWLKATGMHIPNDISLLSFGNNQESQALPITTIDFGFESLGYNAIHAILQDIPLSYDSPNAIAAHPRIVNRGSLSRVRNEKFTPMVDGEVW
jgi:DNA-binding GntR family transcriptional regulator